MSRRTARESRPESRTGTRLQRVMAEAGVASRRAAEELIRSGRVSLNGRVVRSLGVRADPRRDVVRVDGRRIGRPARRRSYVVYKPRGVVCTTRDPDRRRTVLDLVPSPDRLFPVGRLDAASEGLLLLTNDGALTQALLHPSFGVPRVYRVSVEGEVRAETLRRLTRGVRVGGHRVAAREVRIHRREPGRTVLRVTLTEGRRRQIREMMRAVGHPVRRLVRVEFGPLRLRGLRPGEWRPLHPPEERALARMVQDATATRQPRTDR